MIRRLALNLLMVFSGCILALLLCEVGLRMAFPNRYFETADEYTGWKGLPGAEGRTIEGNNFFRLNSQGLHDREHTKEKQPGTLRIAVLGDSMAEGLQVPTERTFSTVLERELATCARLGGRRVEVINFGVSGYGTAQELLTLRHRVWEYAPEIVVLTFTSVNDLSDNSYKLWPYPRPYFVHRDGKLVLDESHMIKPFQARLYFWVRLHSRVLQLLIETKDRYQTRPTGVGGDGGRFDIYRTASDPAWEEAWRVTEDMMVTMRDEVAARRAKFLVVTLSNAAQVSPDAAERRRVMERLGVESLFYPDLRIKALGEREGIPVLNLAPGLQLYAEQHQVFLHGFRVNNSFGHGHWNEEGHRLAGEMIARNICAGILAP